MPKPSKKWTTKKVSIAGRLPARGAPNGPKRTPRHLGDKAIADTYEVEDIVGERNINTADGGRAKEWLVHWKGYTDEANTWEPLANLAGAETFIARFNEERDAANLRQQQQREKAREEKRGRAEEEEQQEEQQQAAKQQLEPEGRKTSFVWRAFVE